MGLWVLTLVVLILDRVSKLFISKVMIVGETRVVIDDFFRITYVQNTGAAFSILQNGRWLLIGLGVLVVGLLVWYLQKNRPQKRIDTWGYAFLLGGTIGNLIDRLWFGYVIDFLDFELGGYQFAIFNIADIGIVLGVMMLIIGTVRRK